MLRFITIIILLRAIFLTLNVKINLLTQQSILLFCPSGMYSTLLLINFCIPFSFANPLKPIRQREATLKFMIFYYIAKKAEKLPQYCTLYCMIHTSGPSGSLVGPAYIHDCCI